MNKRAFWKEPGLKTDSVKQLAVRHRLKIAIRHTAGLDTRNLGLAADSNYELKRLPTTLSTA